MSAAKSRLWPVLAWFNAAIPIAGWMVAQTLPSRIAIASEGNTALVHSVAASTFAVILLVSAVINAVLITSRTASLPRSYRWGRLGVWQAVLFVLELGWLTCIVIGTAGYNVEPFFGVGIAAASCVVFAFARSKDPDAALRRSERVAARTPEATHRIRVAKMAIPVALALIGTLVVAVLALVPLTHYGCEVQGSGSVKTGGQSTFTVYTSCGDFVSDVPGSSNESLLYPQVPFDMTTQGFQLIPPRLRLIAFEPSQ